MSRFDRAIPAQLVHMATALVVVPLALFYAFVLRARLELGHWPVAYQPDPKLLGFDLHHTLVWLGLFAILAAPALCGLGYLVARWGRADTALPHRPAALFAGGFALAAILLVSDLGAFLHWFAD